MIQKWRSIISLRKAGWCSLCVGVIGILLHILVLADILPYQWINGGRTESLSQAYQTAALSIVIIVVMKLITLFGARILPMRRNKTAAVILRAALIAIACFSFIGVIQQLLGTIFEKCILSVVNLIGFVADVRIAAQRN